MLGNVNTRGRCFLITFAPRRRRPPPRHCRPVRPRAPACSNRELGAHAGRHRSGVAREDSRKSSRSTPRCKTSCDTMRMLPIGASPWSVAHRLGSLKSDELGIVCSAKTGMAVGCVVLLERDRRIAVVKKAYRPGYAFAGLWSLPGGVVRVEEPFTAVEPDQLAALANASLLKRARAECGWSGENDDLLIAGSLIPRVSSYETSKGIAHTLVLPFWATATADFTPRSVEHKSVEDARWMSIADLDGRLTPASCLIVASALDRHFSAAEQASWRSHVEIAERQCGRWAAEVGWHDEVPPWSF